MNYKPIQKFLSHSAKYVAISLILTLIFGPLIYVAPSTVTVLVAVLIAGVLTFPFLHVRSTKSVGEVNVK